MNPRSLHPVRAFFACLVACLCLAADPHCAAQDRSPADLAAQRARLVLPALAFEGQPRPDPAGEPMITRPASPQAPVDRCALPDVTANPTRPTWDFAASTTQCGVLESDLGYQYQPMEAGVVQNLYLSSLRYGLTPKLDLRWGLINHMYQNRAGAFRQGSGDQWLGGRYRFVEPGRLGPALALLYAAKVPMASPTKGLGSGFTDHQLVFIVSRDLGRAHFDFNCAGTLAGSPRGWDGAAQYGLALSRPMTHKLTWTLESYGGPQPGTADRFGAALMAATYTLRSFLVLDIAWSQTYTAGSPRQQGILGITYAHRSGLAPRSRNARSRMLGR